MRKVDEMKEAAQAASALRSQLEVNDRAVRQFLGSATLVQSAYTQALGRVSDALRTLERSFQAVAAAGLNAFAGALNAIRPAAEQIASVVTRLFGVTVWKSNAKAVEGTASALGRVAKSARSAAQAQKDLYSFDQITRVSAKSGSGSAGSSGSTGRGSGGSGAEGTLLRIPGLLDALAARAREVLAQIWQPFQAAWASQGEQTLEAAREELEAIAQAAGAVGQSWLNAWTGGAGELAVTTVLQIAQRLSQAAGSLANQFRTAWTAGGAGDAIFRGLLALCQSVLNSLRDMATATAVWAGQLDFSGLVQGFAGLVSAAKPLVELLASGLSWGYTNVLLPLAGWVIQAAGPAMLNLLSGAVGLLTSVLNLLKPVGQFVWESLLKPMGSWTGGLLVAGINAVAGAFRTLSSVLNQLPASWQNLKERIATIWSGIQSAMVGAAGGCRTGVVSAFTALTAGVQAQGVQLKTKLLSVFGTVASGVRDKLAGIKSALTAPFKNGLNAVIDLVNRVIRKINSALKFSWPAVKVGGQTIVAAGSVTLAKMPTISKLAEGGIATGPTFSLIGEAGREAVLPLDRNTGWMDQLAERIVQALGQNGGGETVIEVHIGGEQLTRQVVRGVNDVTRRTGRCPIYI